MGVVWHQIPLGSLVKTQGGNQFESLVSLTGMPGKRPCGLNLSLPVHRLNASVAVIRAIVTTADVYGAIATGHFFGFAVATGNFNDFTVH